MKIGLDSYGSYLEPDEEPRDTPFHMRIVRVEKISVGHQVTLACGHGVQIIGDLALAEGKAFCTKCRDLEEK